jgi:hypothetical protein
MIMDPRSEYSERLKQREAAAARHNTRHHRIGNARLAVFVAAAAMAWFAFKQDLFSAWWLMIPLVVFIALIAWHSQVLRRLQRIHRGIEFYERGLSRLEDRWEGAGEKGDRFADASHPYAQDLDIFGKGSLFQLLCCARTHAGEAKLATWLKTAAPPDEIRSRQGAVAELREKFDLREDLAMLGSSMRAGVDPDPLIQWGRDPVVLDSLLLRIFAAIIALLALGALIFWALKGQQVWFFLMALIEVIFIYFFRHTVRKCVHSAEKACRDLQLFSLVLARFEKERFETDHLISLRTSLDRDGLPPSRLIGRLSYLMVLLDSRKNPYFAPVGFVLLWEMQLAFFIEDWRARYGLAIAHWLEAVSELEALSSLAGYAFEHPHDPFPEVIDQPPCFVGRGLGHPLISEAKCVRNDVSLTTETRVLVVSGSNMSGKSTLLRTVGINSVMALAGAPVRAQYLKIAPLALGASIRIMDSLQEGTSRFYAEITRLQKLAALANGPVPLMFLLDELLHGTNSHDRRIGAEAIIKGLARRGAVGLLTTHDLALASIVDALAPHATNVHFEDHIQDGKIIFDYLLRPGIVTKSNALELMRSIGLEV